MASQSPWDISVEDLKQLRDAGADFVLIDVREPQEVAVSHLDGIHVPLGQLAGRLGEFDRDAHVVVHCRSGGRSAKAVEVMRGAGFSNAWNVQGGLLAWAERVEPGLEVA